MLGPPASTGRCGAGPNRGIPAAAAAGPPSPGYGAGPPSGRHSWPERPGRGGVAERRAAAPPRRVGPYWLWRNVIAAVSGAGRDPSRGPRRVPPAALASGPSAAAGRAPHCGATALPPSAGPASLPRHRCRRPGPLAPRLRRPSVIIIICVCDTLWCPLLVFPFCCFLSVSVLFLRVPSVFCVLSFCFFCVRVFCRGAACEGARCGGSFGFPPDSPVLFPATGGLPSAPPCPTPPTSAHRVQAALPPSLWPSSRRRRGVMVATLACCLHPSLQNSPPPLSPCPPNGGAALPADWHGRPSLFPTPLLPGPGRVNSLDVDDGLDAWRRRVVMTLASLTLPRTVLDRVRTGAVCPCVGLALSWHGRLRHFLPPLPLRFHRRDLVRALANVLAAARHWIASLRLRHGLSAGQCASSAAQFRLFEVLPRLALDYRLRGVDPSINKKCGFTHAY